MSESIESDIAFEITTSVEKIHPFTRYNFYKKIPELKMTSHLSVYRLGSTLIDTGSLPVSEPLLSLLGSQKIDRIILTHQHEDHIGGLPALLKKFPAVKIFAPEKLVDIIHKGFTVPRYRRAYWGGLQIFDGEIIAYNEDSFFQQDQFLLKAIALPGHTPYQIGFLVEHKDVMYVLSADLYIAARLPAAWMETSVPDFIDSLQTLINLETKTGKKLFILPTHGKVLPDGAEKLQVLLSWYRKIQDTVLKCASRLKTRDYYSIFFELYKEFNHGEFRSKGELSRLNLIRGVLDPVKNLPATLLQVPET